MEALEGLEQCRRAITAHDYAAAMRHGKRAKHMAEAAFFNPTMVSLLYFPDEHKFAVFMPFFVPVLVPLVWALVAEFKAYRAQRRLLGGGGASKAKVE
jgi:phosphatidylinositol glycan class S